MMGVPPGTTGEMGEVGLSLGAVSPYEGLSHVDVIARFVASRGEEPGIGGELSRRLVEHAGLDVDPTSVPLIHEGEQATADDGRPLTWADYVDWASGRLGPHRHSGHAIRGVLGFLQLERGTPDYESGRLGLMSRIQQSAQAG
jgi:hypothetical protein